MKYYYTHRRITPKRVTSLWEELSLLHSAKATQLFT